MKPYSKRLVELASSGGSARSIAAQLRAEGFKVSKSAADRELRGLRGEQRMPRRPVVPLPSQRVSQPVEASHDVEDAPIDGFPSAEQVAGERDPAQLGEWLEVARHVAVEGRRTGNLPILARAAQLGIAIAEAQRRASPPDPAPTGAFISNGELEAAGEQARERWHTLIDGLASRMKASGELCRECGRPRMVRS